MRVERMRAAAAGATAALVWAALEPLDRRVFGYGYSDVALLGKTVTRGRAWPAVGVTLHAVNGAVFGLVYAEVARRTRAAPRRLALGLALAEHVALFPLSFAVDRWHPARGERGLPPLVTSGRAFAQATVRHAVFGLVLGRLAASTSVWGDPVVSTGRFRRTRGRAARPDGGVASAAST